MNIGSIDIGDGARLALIAGINVIEDEDTTLAAAEQIAERATRHDMPLVFKASFDKANRTRVDAFRGPGIEGGLEILARVKKATALPLITDVHECWQAAPASEVVDCLQIPAFLCRQTDLLAACAATGLPINVKKGQFIAPTNMQAIVEKLTEFGCDDVMLTERGTQLGYHELVVDMTALLEMRRFAPVCFDATHAVQQPGARDGASGGRRECVAPLARAAAAVGIDALFIEAHRDPESAPCDGPSQIDFDSLDTLLTEVRAVDAALRKAQRDTT